MNSFTPHDLSFRYNTTTGLNKLPSYHCELLSRWSRRLARKSTFLKEYFKKTSFQLNSKKLGPFLVFHTMSRHWNCFVFYCYGMQGWTWIEAWKSWANFFIYLTTRLPLFQITERIIKIILSLRYQKLFRYFRVSGFSVTSIKSLKNNTTLHLADFAEAFVMPEKFGKG